MSNGEEDPNRNQATIGSCSMKTEDPWNDSFQLSAKYLYILYISPSIKKIWFWFHGGTNAQNEKAEYQMKYFI